MLRAFAILLVCQLAGEGITRALALPLPGPVLGLVIQNLALLREYGVALAAALVVSTLLTLSVTVWVFVGVSRLMDRKG